MWLASILVMNTLTMLTIAHADRGRSQNTYADVYSNNFMKKLSNNLMQKLSNNLMQKLSFQLHHLNYIIAIGFANLCR